MCTSVVTLVNHHHHHHHHQNNLLWRHSTGAQQRLTNSTVHTIYRLRIQCHIGQPDKENK